MVTKINTDTQLNDFSWFKTKKVAGGVWAIDDHGVDAMYLICGEKKSILIDTGIGIGNLAGLISNISSLPVIVVHTHGHPDHAGGDYQFPTVYISQQDLSLMHNCFSKENRRWWLKYFPDKEYPLDFSPKDWLKTSLKQIPTKIYSLKNGDQFDLGGRIIQTIALPGHTPGSVGLLDINNRLFFPGDSVLTGEIWMHLKESEPLSTYFKSISFLDSISNKFDLIFPAHAKSPLDKNILQEIIYAVSLILEGKMTGQPYHTFAGNGLLCRFQRFGMVYNKNKI